MNGSDEINIKHFANSLRRLLPGGPLGMPDAGVVDPDIHFAEAIHAGVPQIFNLHAIRYITQLSQDSSRIMPLTELAQRFIQAGFVTAAHHDSAIQSQK